MSFKTIAKKYAEVCGLLPLTLTLEWNPETKKKQIPEDDPSARPKAHKGKYTDPKQWEQYIKSHHSCMALKMGEKYDEKHRLVMVDIDKHGKEGKKPGMLLMTQLFDQHNYESSSWTQETPTGGYHIFYKVTEDDFRKLSNSVGCGEYEIDVRAENGLAYVYPSEYGGPNGEKMEYKWMIAPWDKGAELELMPQFLIEQFAKKHKPITASDEKYDIETVKKLCEMVATDVWSADRLTWIRIGTSMKACNDSAECAQLFEEFSSLSTSNYTPGEPTRIWPSLDVSRASPGTLKYFARESNPEEYAKLFRYANNELLNDGFIDAADTLRVNTDFLMKRDDVLDEKRDGTTDQNKIKDALTQFVENRSPKILAIKSHMGSGKTHTTKQIISNLKTKRGRIGERGFETTEKEYSVLWITHRQSFANNLYNNFKDLDFYCYMEDEHKKMLHAQKRVICSFESLHLLVKDGRMKKYDLVVLDEIESLLAHFESPTMKTKRETFNQFVTYLNNSKKILALDADFGIRSYSFLQQHSQDIKIIMNECKNSNRRFVFNTQKEYFVQAMMNALHERKNIVLVSMSSTIAKQLHERLKMTQVIAELGYDPKKVLHCSTSDDKLKENLKDVETYWSECEYVAFTPSVDAGVDYSSVHFDKMFCVLSSQSTSYRGFMQMTGRVRHLKEQDILVTPFSHMFATTRKWKGKLWTKQSPLVVNGKSPAPARQ
eukprot:CAMPEP_0117449408 /NCGR_PEP_ID=MMETSP0759-20121206/7931_1 /TAXON_ID=63605 /ORGANISM="Percolomonas cosmopolitus, Strain WS" /LENGTH=715 /DNA_ID=CAMNT_0005241885 /DNA_START=535 /DNA_END=2682 /DNA_ORIENTATION=-